MLNATRTQRVGKLDVSTGIIFSIYTVGQMAGSLFAGQICDRCASCPSVLYCIFNVTRACRWGRRAGMFIGTIHLIGIETSIHL